MTITLYWQALAPPTGDYTVFVHLLNEEGLVAQHDSPPRYGRYPTSDWHTGDMVPDEHRLELPTLAPGQLLRLVVGMYRSDTLERLPAIGPDGPVIDNIIPLPLEPQ